MQVLRFKRYTNVHAQKKPKKLFPMSKLKTYFEKRESEKNSVRMFFYLFQFVTQSEKMYFRRITF